MFEIFKTMTWEEILTMGFLIALFLFLAGMVAYGVYNSMKPVDFPETHPGQDASEPDPPTPVEKEYQSPFYSGSGLGAHGNRDYIMIGAFIIIVLTILISFFISDGNSAEIPANKVAQSPLSSPIITFSVVSTPPIPPTEMVLIPAGDFTMGSTEEDIMWAAQKFFSESLEYYRDETPAHSVTLEKYEIDKTEVTVGQYKLYMEKTGKPAPKFMDNDRFNGDFQPVVGVTWQEAQDYCVWNGKRLPTEAEWERAARGTDGRYYPWGSDPDPNRSNARGTKDGYHYSSPVGMFANGVSPSGTLDMAGNVWEWTADWYDGYPGTTHQSDMFGKNYKIIRGGSWFSNLDLARSAVRGKMSPDRRQNYIGFRCVR